MKKILFGLAALAMVVFCGCDVTDPIYDAVYNIKVSNDGHGTGAASFSGKSVDKAPEKQTVTITATPAVDYVFKRWVVVSGGVTLSSTTTSPANFTMPATAVEIKAEFNMTANAAAQGTTLAFDAAASTGANTVYTFTPPTSAATATIATATVTCNDAPVTSTLAGTGNVNLTFTDAVLAALPYDKDLIVTYTVTNGGQTSTAVTTRTILATEIAAMADIQAIRKATAHAEAAKISIYVSGSAYNDASNIGINLPHSPFTSGTVLQLVDIKTGAASPGVTTDLGASLNTLDNITEKLSLNTQKVVDAANITYVGVVFTVTLNGVTSDPVTQDISQAFLATSTAGKLRADKAKISGALEVSGFSDGVKNVQKDGVDVQLSSGVAMTSATNLNDGAGILAGTATISAAEGGVVTINYSTAPTTTGSNNYAPTLTCNGTTYTPAQLSVAVVGIQ